jgi:hypothetical protein
MQPIQPERIEILPDTHLCCDHARKIAKFGGEFTITAVRERTSKAGSLKKNYGGVTPSKRRNHRALEQLRDEHLEELEQRKNS